MSAYETGSQLCGTGEAKEALEAMVDRAGLPEVLALLSEICQEKADHIRENWQDESLAKVWEDKSSAIDTATFGMIK